MVLISATLVSPALAQKEYSAQKMNKAMVKDFIAYTTKITRGAVDRDDISDITDFLKAHIHNDARFKSAMEYVMPGFPAQKNTLKLDKAKYIQNIIDGAGKIGDYDVSVKVKSVKFSKNKRVATVITENTERAMIAVPGRSSNEEQRVPITGDTTCTQILKVNDDDIVQMYHAKCTTKIMFAGL